MINICIDAENSRKKAKEMENICLLFIQHLTDQE